jgi:predicted CXXCH cytochrome family protein
MLHRFLAAAGIVAAALMLTAADPSAAPAILRPVDGAVIKPGAFLLIARGSGKAELHVDGKPVAAAEVGPGAWTAALQAAPGNHEALWKTPAGEHRIHFQVNAAGSYRPHPPAAACDSCHAVSAGAWALKGVSVESSCSVCHDLKSFATGHSHNTETLAECQMCHDPHGSAVKAHLKLPKATACKQCHG